MVKGGNFVRNAGTLFSGNVIAQGAAFAAYLALSRLYSPEDFGLYNVFYSYIEVLIILSTCKYELAIVRAETDIEAAALTRLTLRLNAINSCVLLGIGLVLSLLTHWGVMRMPLPPLLIMLIPPMVFFCGTTRVYTFLFNRYKHYRQIASAEVATSLGGVAAKILLGIGSKAWTLMHAAGLPLGTILGKVAGNVYYRSRCLRMMKREEPCCVATISKKELLTKYRNFPLYATPKELVSSFSANLPFMWLSLYFDNAYIGLFSLAVTFTMRPVNIFANIFEKVLYPQVTQRVNQGLAVWGDIRRFVLVLNAIAVPVLAAMFWGAEPIFTFLFGEKWIGTGYYVRCIIPWIWVLITANSLSFTANVFGTQRVDFILQMVQLVLRVGALWVGCKRNDFQLAIMIFCAVSTLMQLVQLGWYLYQLRTKRAAE